MKKNQENNLVSWDDHIDKKYGIIGTPTRDKYKEEEARISTEQKIVELGFGGQLHLSIKL